MLRVVATRVASAARIAIMPQISIVGTQCIRATHNETDDEFDQRYVNFFNRNDIDHWEIRKAMNDLAGMDLVPEPKIICAALKACRRLNDFALAVRFIECIRDKGGPHAAQIYPYILQEIRPILDDLGISTPEELGYDKPELAYPEIHEM
ncbi:Cytochrome c oxidase subunit 5A, mitochondrial [Atta colombica]|uniref:Cytochrome c oxidase subunit 5A, mitochondrial n=1 Tax=Atta colombica TaxID=520822 RepID=A0A195BX99_9HYME|nr:PREDICTED: cytochrome c oxidase subunit 5A, mitochondrial [Atta colombica]KYM93207.1 Cytochrome c oxidase subunit 5A, mitochondrial [Atta colombica]